MGKVAVTKKCPRSQRLYVARERWKQLKVIIEDEISLDNTAQDDTMNRTLNDAFQVPECEKKTTIYNNISMIKVGDFMQLNLRGTPIFENKTNAEDPYANLRPNRWKDNFKCFELTECMRQRNDNNFARILNTARYMTINRNDNLENLASHEKQVISFFRSRQIQPDHPDYPLAALHIFPTNMEVDGHNAKMIKTIPNTLTLNAQDSRMDASGSFVICELKKSKDDKTLP